MIDFRSHCRIALWLVAAGLLVSCIGGGGRSGMRGAVGGVGVRAEPAALFLGGLDSSLDGVVSARELTTSYDRLWVSAHPSQTGNVSILELNAWRQHWFGTSDGWPGQFHFDSDGDSLVTRTEFETGLKAIFDDFDANKDGNLDRAELLTRSPRAAGGARRGR